LSAGVSAAAVEGGNIAWPRERLQHALTLLSGSTARQRRICGIA
jgi:hypothetical protein